jgi:hypothetical protein
VVLRERDDPGGLGPRFIADSVRYLLNNGYHVVLEGNLRRDLNGPHLRDLLAAQRGTSSVFYLDIPFEETLRRRATRPQSVEFTPDDMRGWYRPQDTLCVEGERLIGPEVSVSLEDMADLIARRSRLV